MTIFTFALAGANVFRHRASPRLVMLSDLNSKLGLLSYPRLCSLLLPNQSGAVCAPLMIDFRARIGEFTPMFEQEATAWQGRVDEAEVRCGSRIFSAGLSRDTEPIKQRRRRDR